MGSSGSSGSSENTGDANMKNVMETYKRLGIAPTEGKGSWLFD